MTSDPNIVENLVAELVSELMAERRAICPSDVAKIVHFASRRDAVPIVRRSAAQLAQNVLIGITRGDEAVASFTGGPVRLRRGSQFPDAPPSPT